MERGRWRRWWRRARILRVGTGKQKLCRRGKMWKVGTATQLWSAQETGKMDCSTEKKGVKVLKSKNPNSPPL